MYISSQSLTAGSPENGGAPGHKRFLLKNHRILGSMFNLGSVVEDDPVFWGGLRDEMEMVKQLIFQR